MKTFVSKTTLVAITAALSAAGSTPGSAQPPSPPRAAIPDPIKLSPPPAVVTGNVPPSVTLSPSGASLPVQGIGRSLAQRAFLAQLEAAPASAFELWNKSGLAMADLIYLVESASENDASKGKVRLALAGILAKQSEVMQNAPQHSAKVRLALADYYASVKDAKAVGLYEGLLAEVEKSGPQKREVFEVEKLARYYAFISDFGKAAEVMTRIKKYTVMPALVGNGLVQAARFYRAAGQEEKAEALYRDSIQTTGEWGWAKGMAIYDQAGSLIKQGRHEDARKLLSTPVTGQFADQIKVILLCRLGVSFYMTGEFEMARKHLKATGEQYKSLVSPLKGEGLETFVNIAQSYLEYIDTWNKEPIVSLPRDLHVIVRAKENLKEPLKEPWIIEGPRLIPIRVLSAGQPLVELLTLRSFRTIPMAVKTNNPYVQARLMDRGKPEDAVTHAEKELKIEVSPEVFKERKTLNATVTISSPMFPDFQVRIPIQIDVQD